MHHAISCVASQNPDREDLFKWMEADCAVDQLSIDDWAILEKVKLSTKALESSFATLDSVLLATDFVLVQFEEQGGKH
ncbi:hypothetical protein HIM_12604 [Hirsutella minnesotensis 3608]|uniref:Uncharacterized protein n=1 Tax=Hirsutella minnesotensis 3608 TaxID=1043627 RepID=A0A0F7ZHU2_9HYPO|nr:hypothetical protein HIM_12604 [Hirsutella minnesotensis 3608]